MTRVEIVRHTPDELVRYTWTFCFFEDRLFLCLDAFTTEIRQTRRHKFKLSQDVLQYSRLTNTKMKEENVPLPDGVLEHARNEIIGKIRVGRWRDGKGPG